MERSDWGRSHAENNRRAFVSQTRALWRGWLLKWSPWLQSVSIIQCFLPLVFNNYFQSKRPKWENSEKIPKNEKSFKLIAFLRVILQSFEVAVQNGTKTAFALFSNLCYDFCWKWRVTKSNVTFLFLDGLINFLMIIFRNFILFRIKFVIFHFGLFVLGSCKSLHKAIGSTFCSTLSCLGSSSRDTIPETMNSWKVGSGTEIVTSCSIITHCTIVGDKW